MPHRACGARAGLPLILSALAPADAAQQKVYLAGSAGSEPSVPGMLTLPETVADIISMTGKATPRVLFLGTAFYDSPLAEEAQTQGFIKKSCTVDVLKVAIQSTTPTQAAIESSFDQADVILLGGGNALFAYDRWVKLGIDKLIKSAWTSGKLMAGGSSGAMAFFDGGNSGALQPRKFKNPPGPLIKQLTAAVNETYETHIRVPGLGLLHGVVCPHYDTQNGARAAGFTTLLQQHSGETALGMDHWAAMKIEGNTYTVIGSAGKHGSVGSGGTFQPGASGTSPGAWKLSIDTKGQLVRTLIPTNGKVSDIFTPAKYISQSAMLQVARGMNPDDNIPCDACGPRPPGPPVTPPPVPPPAARWACGDGTCIQANIGHSTQSTCMPTCNPPAAGMKFICGGFGQCYQKSDGPYSSINTCNNQC